MKTFRTRLWDFRDDAGGAKLKRPGLAGVLWSRDQVPMSRGIHLVGLQQPATLLLRLAFECAILEVLLDSIYSV